MEFSIVFSISFIICFLYIFSLIKLLLIGTIILKLFGLILLLYYLIKKPKDFIKTYHTKSILTFLVLFFTLSLTLSHVKILDFDNFSHWLVIARQMFELNNLPDASNILTTYYDYPPGSAYLIYFFAQFTSNFEYMAILAQTIFEILLLLPIFIFARNNFQYIISCIMIIFFLVLDISTADLLVDSLLGIFVFNTFMLIYYYKNDLKKLLKLLIPFNLTLLLLKNVAIFFYGIEFILLIIIFFKRKIPFKNCLKNIFLFLIPAFFFILWKIRNKIVFASIGFLPAQSVSLTNYKANLEEKSLSDIAQIFKNFTSNLFDIHNLFAILFIIILILSIIFMFKINKNNRKDKLSYFTFIILIYFGYALLLFVSYLISMTTYEALNLACFDRYFLTGMFLLVGMSVILYFNQNNNSKILNIIISTCLIICIFTSPNSAHLIGIRNDKESDRMYVENVIGNYKKGNDKVLVISPKSKESGLIKFCTTYFLGSRDYKLIINTDELEKIKINDYDTIIIYETNKDVNTFMSNVKNYNKTKGLYKVGDDSD